MEPATVEAIVTAACNAWTPANDIEVTLEANPSSVEADRFAAYAIAGVNRVSLGIQALNDADLRRLGRAHSADEALRAIGIAQTSFNRVSIDLIYARQHQTPEQWEAELEKALSLGTRHLSLYQLTIEPGTVFGERFNAGKLMGLPEEDRSLDLFEITQDLTKAHGLNRYEVSNHAQSGEESRHNLVYWRYGDYVGIGPGAHGRVTFNNERFATEHHRMPFDWSTAVEAGTGESLRDKLTRQQSAEEFVMMGLRLMEGIDLDRYRNISGSDLNASVITDLVELGFLTREKAKIIPTNQGLNVLNAMLNRLLTTP